MPVVNYMMKPIPAMGGNPRYRAISAAIFFLWVDGILSDTEKASALKRFDALCEKHRVKQ